MSLSDKIKVDCSGPYGEPRGPDFLLPQDVREAVRELKESLKEGIDDYTGADYKAIIAKIDEIFGEKLI